MYARKNGNYNYGQYLTAHNGVVRFFQAIVFEKLAMWVLLMLLYYIEIG